MRFTVSGLVPHNAVQQRLVSSSRPRSKALHELVQRGSGEGPRRPDVADVVHLLHARQPSVRGALQSGGERRSRTQLVRASPRVRAPFHAEGNDPTRRPTVVLLERNVRSVSRRRHDLRLRRGGDTVMLAAMVYARGAQMADRGPGPDRRPFQSGPPSLRTSVQY